MTAPSDLPFTKMQGLGNDFVVLDGREDTLSLDPAQLRRLADRRIGVGCDQVLVLERAPAPDAARYRIFNPDGGEVEQCGNGVRCVARWLYDRGEIDEQSSLLSAAGRMQVTILGSGRVKVGMGVPATDPARVPVISDEPGPEHDLAVAGTPHRFVVLSMGNPHAVLEVPDVDSAPVLELGEALQQHPAFPRQVNAGFVQVLDSSRVRLRVFERGAGETQACGSGACAAAAAMILRERVTSPVEVELPGGALGIEWSGPGAQVMMTGPAEYAFSGTIDLHS